MSGRRPGGGMRGGGMKGGGGRGGGPPSMTVGRSNPMLEMWKKREAKKAKKIKKILTKDQKNLYKQIRKHKTKQVKKRLEAMQEKMGMGRR